MAAQMVAWFVWSRLVLAAGPSEPQVRWTAPSDCGDEASLMASVREFMRADLPASAAGQVHIEATVERRGDEYLASVRVQTPLGASQREITAETCEQARSATAIVVAVALDPLTIAQAAAPSNEVPQAEARERDDAAPPRKERPGLSVRADGVFDYGSLDAIAGGASVALGVSVKRARVELRGTYLAPVVHRPLAPDSQAGVEVQLGTAGVHGCFVPAVKSIEFQTCVWGEGGAVRGRGLDVATTKTRHDPWVAAGITAGIGWHPSMHFSLWLRANGLAVLFRPKFSIDGVGTVYRAGPAAIRLELGPEVRF